MDIHHILAQTAFSESSKQAIDYAYAPAQKCGAKLSLLHVIEVPVYPGEDVVPGH